MKQTTAGGPWTAADGAPGEDHAHVAVRAEWLERWRQQFDDCPVDALLTLVDEYGAERAVEVLASGDPYEPADTATAARARAVAVRAHLEALLGNPGTIRRVAALAERP